MDPRRVTLELPYPCGIFYYLRIGIEEISKVLSNIFILLGSEHSFFS